jgi:hypothetical protein
MKGQGPLTADNGCQRSLLGASPPSPTPSEATKHKAARRKSRHCHTYLQEFSLAHALSTMPRDHVGALVGQNSRQLVLILHQLEQACAHGGSMGPVGFGNPFSTAASSSSFISSFI